FSSRRRHTRSYGDWSSDVCSSDLQHEITKPIPLIVYSSHQHFEQTNVSPGFLPEGVQGFTEFTKGRVVIPYTGSYGEFRHVIHQDRKSTRLNSSHRTISYAVFCLK